MHDGAIVFNTKIDNSDVAKDLKRLKNEIKKSTEDIAKNENTKLPLVEQLEDVNHELEKARARYQELNEEIAAAQSAMAEGSELEDYMAASDALPKLETALKEQEKTVAGLETRWDSISQKIENCDRKIRQATDSVKGNEEALAALQAVVEAEEERLSLIRENAAISDPRIVEQRELLKALEATKREYEKAGLGEGYEDYDTVVKKIAEINGELREYHKNLTSVKKETGEVADSTGQISTNAGIAQAAEGLADVGEQSVYSGYKMKAAFDKARESAAKFQKRMLQVGASMIMFRVFSAILQGVGGYMKKILQANSEYTAQLAKLKGALMTAFQPIYEFILPGLLTVLRVLTAIVSVAARVLSALFGTSASQSAQNAENLNNEAEAIGGVGDAAKKAKKELAGFDEINTLGSPDTSGGGGGGSGVAADFGDFNTAEYMAKIDELTVYLSGALLALGAILAFSGTNIPLGFALMAAGAIGLAAVVKENWGAMSSELEGALGTVMLLLGGAALVLGAILAFSGANIPLGIVLIAVGAASMVGAAALNWTAVVTALQGPVGQVVAIASAAMLALGLVLAFSGLNIPLGIALIAAGAVGLVTVAALNWNAILEKLQTVWAGIKQWFNTHVKPKLTLEYWKEKFSTIADALEQKIKDGVNAAIALFNKFINWVNEKMVLRWSDFSVGGVKVVEAGSFQLLNIPNIPMLAQGAVLPANKPFLAMVGDQKNGTNVEAPLETIKQALAEVMSMRGGDGDIVIRFEGDLAQLARVLKPVIDRENKRVGPSLAGGNVG